MKPVILCIFALSFALSAQDGSLKWRYEVGEFSAFSPVIGANDVIYACCYDDIYLHAIHSDGSLKWRYEIFEGVSSPVAVGSDGTAYVGSYDGYIYAIDPNGNLRLTYETESATETCPSIGKNGTVYVGCWDNYLYAFNPNGGLQWRYETGGIWNSSAAIGADGTLFLGSLDNDLYALNSDGSFKWGYGTDDWIESSPAIGVDGTVYIGSEDGCLYGFSQEGSLRWRYQTGDCIFSSPVLDTDGTVYIGSADSYLYALNPDGSLKWRYKIGEWIESSPAIGADGTIYMGSSDHYLYALTPEGRLKWRYETGGYIYNSPVIGEDGTVYITSEDGYLYAIETNCGGLSDSAWPMQGSNSGHSGAFSLPFYCSSDAFSFQTLSGDYAGHIHLTGGTTAQITSCDFDCAAFDLSESFPLTVDAGRTQDLSYTIKTDSSAIYSSTCSMEWRTNYDSGQLSFNLSQGIIVDDDSETDVVGAQVLSAFQSSYAKDPQSVATRNNRALLYRFCGYPETSDRILADIEENALDDCYFADIYLLNRGVTCSDLSKPDTALMFYNGVLNNGSKSMSSKAWYNLGWEAYQEDDFDRTLICTDSVMASSMANDYTLAKAWCLRGAALLALERVEEAGSAFIRAEELDGGGPVGMMARQNRRTYVGVEKDMTVPSRFELYPNYPNPFNPVTTIEFALPETRDVTVNIYNTLGQQIRLLHRGRLDAGRHTLHWDSRNDAGQWMGSGVYLCVISAGENKVQKLTLLR